ncbi:hypothetical protein OROMI_019634 [Orobanche minor]
MVVAKKKGYGPGPLAVVRLGGATAAVVIPASYRVQTKNGYQGADINFVGLGEFNVKGFVLEKENRFWIRARGLKAEQMKIKASLSSGAEVDRDVSDLIFEEAVHGSGNKFDMNLKVRVENLRVELPLMERRVWRAAGITWIE